MSIYINDEHRYMCTFVRMLYIYINNNLFINIYAQHK